MRIQSIVVDVTMDISFRHRRIKNLAAVKGMIFRITGPCFLERVAIAKKKEICIYEIKESCAVKFFKEDNLLERIPFYRNMTFDMLKEDVDNLPNRLAVETTDIRVIRELVARGKKLSWFSTDLSFGGNFPGMFNFEHLFLSNKSSGGVVLFPDGNTKKIFASRYKKYMINFDEKEHVFFNLTYSKLHLLNNLDKILGYYPHKIRYYTDKKRMVIARWKLRNLGKLHKKIEKVKDLSFNSLYMQISMVNILSVTYMVWKQRNCVMNAKKKDAAKE